MMALTAGFKAIHIAKKSRSRPGICSLDWRALNESMDCGGYPAFACLFSQNWPHKHNKCNYIFMYELGQEPELKLQAERVGH